MEPQLYSTASSESELSCSVNLLLRPRERWRSIVMSMSVCLSVYLWGSFSRQ